MQTESVPTLYDTLQLQQDASTSQVRAAWRRLASEHHPDRAGPAAAEAMAQINKAYEVLSDPHRRAVYDQILSPREPRRVRTLRESALRTKRLRTLLLAGLPLVLGGAGWAVVHRIAPESVQMAQAPSVPTGKALQATWAAAAPAAATAVEEPLHLIPATRLESWTQPPVRR